MIRPRSLGPCEPRESYPRNVVWKKAQPDIDLWNL